MPKLSNSQLTGLILVSIGSLLSLAIVLIPAENRAQFLGIGGGICTGAIGFLNPKNGKDGEN